MQFLNIKMKINYSHRGAFNFQRIILFGVNEANISRFVESSKSVFEKSFSLINSNPDLIKVPLNNQKLLEDYLQKDTYYGDAFIFLIDAELVLNNDIEDFKRTFRLTWLKQYFENSNQNKEYLLYSSVSIVISGIGKFLVGPLNGLINEEINAKVDFVESKIREPMDPLINVFNFLGTPIGIFSIQEKDSRNAELPLLPLEYPFLFYYANWINRSLLPILYFHFFTGKSSESRAIQKEIAFNQKAVKEIKAVIPLHISDHEIVKVCRNCKHPINYKNDVVCPNCGGPVFGYLLCNQCKQIIPIGKYCSQCGNKLMS
jgi:RNA polymerase subunit RPABC4/transcription elongation factor Spt4